MSDQRPWLTVIIVNYNGGQFLQRALDSLANQTDQDFTLILVDNASTDGSLDNLKTDHLPEFQLISCKENLGFAAANNLAARSATTEWIALLNPDAEAFEDWVAAFRSATTAHPSVSMFAGATLSMETPERIDGAGDAYFGFGLPWRGGFGHSASDMPDAGTCFSPCGAAALYRRDVFLKEGGFDERFFCYCEDVDLAFRLRLRGETCIFWPDAKALHFGGGTSGKASDFAVYHGARNRIWTYFWNMPPLALIGLLPFHLLLNFSLVLRGAIKGELKPTLRGLRDGIWGGHLWSARHTRQARRSVSSWHVLKAMSWNPWIILTRGTDVRPFDGD
ncbi:MAG: glycosyltransferase family 2 protein [Pseudomonadota bacterium]